jgi:hypothetical protein
MTDQPTCTSYLNTDIDGDDEIIARHVTRTEAVAIAIEHSGKWSVQLKHQEFDTFRRFELSRCSRKTFATDPSNVLVATVPRTDNLAADEAAAREIIEIQFLRREYMFWDGTIESDAEYAAREKRFSERREVRRIDKEIATKLVDALIGGGYSITGDLLNDLRFNHSTARSGILKQLFKVDMAELQVHKGNTTEWLRLIFGASGWDLIQDYTENLSPLADPIVEPYLPWNQPNAHELDHGYKVFVLRSPEDIDEVAEHLK